MSDIDLDLEGATSRANSIAELYASIVGGSHPAIISVRKAHRDELCATGYFCCGPCNCAEPETCAVWWNDGGCDDQALKASDKILGEIDKRLADSVAGKDRGKLTQNLALTYTNERVSSMLNDSMLASTESILVGMTNTFLQAGAIAGAVAGASQVFASTINYYASSANGFIQFFKPYNPPPIGGGGGLS